MNDELQKAHIEEVEERGDKPSLPHALALGGATFLTVGAVDVLAHLGPTGLVIGGIAAIVAARHGSDICELAREMIAPSGSGGQVAQQFIEQRPQRHSGRSFMDRAFGRFPASAPSEEEGREDSPPPEEETPEQSGERKPFSPMFPPGPPNKTLKLGYVVQTQQRFDPPMNWLLGRGGLLAGSQGTGKSNIIGLIAQSGGQCGMPIVIIDFKGEFYTLREVLPNGILVGHPSYADEVGPGFFPLTVDSAAELAQIVMEGLFQVVVDVPSYDGDGDEVAQIIAALLHGFMDWSRKMRRSGNEPWPCLVVTDEAHHFLPERQKLSAFAMKKPAESFGVLTSAYSRMANSGRSSGYTLVIATQRLPNIAKWSIANLQVKVVLAHSEKNDLDACEEETGGLVDREEIKRLATGTGVVIGLTREPTIVHFDRQKARHVSNTPKVERLDEMFQGATRPHLSQVLARRHPRTGQYEQIDQPTPAPAAQQRQPLLKQQAYNPRQPSPQWGTPPLPDLEPTPAPRRLEGMEFDRSNIPRSVPPERPSSTSPHIPAAPQRPPRHQEKYARAIAVWHELEAKQSATMRDFAAAMNMNDARAYNLLCEMEKWQLIHWERRKKKAI